MLVRLQYQHKKGHPYFVIYMYVTSKIQQKKSKADILYPTYTTK